MTQEMEHRSIPDYPFGISNAQTVSGTTSFTTALAGTNAVTTGANITTSFTRMFTGTLTYNENAVYYFVLDRIETDDAKLQLLEPISASVSYQDKAYFCQNEELGIVSMSAKLEDCLKDFQDEMLFVWNEYGKESDDRLTDGAKELKRRIQHYLGK
jgi:hypothetical protein